MASLPKWLDLALWHDQKAVAFVLTHFGAGHLDEVTK